MTRSPKSLTSHARMATGIHGYLVILFLVIFSVEYSRSQHHDLHELLEPFHQLPHLHNGVVRDFEVIKEMPYDTPSNKGDINAIVPGDRSERNAPENIKDLTDRKLQNEIGFCYDALYLADQNNDNEVDADEFVTFVQIMGPAGFLPNSETYQELPLILQSNFIILACLCLQMPSFDGGSGIDPLCCAEDPHIDIRGTQPGEVATSVQSQYLYQVCFLTETSINRLLLSAAPTTEPITKPPTPITPKPTGEPTYMPTGKPTDADPTGKPTDEPTDKLTVTPTAKVTSEPTRAPTEKPTDKPTVTPTAKVTSEPTRAPTEKPTDQPTDQPTSKPTREPTDQPTREPTSKPTREPTRMPTSEPSERPSDEPTKNPTMSPTLDPTFEPTATPTVKPTVKPTGDPTIEPTQGPSESPSEKLTTEPSAKPTEKPTDSSATSTPTTILRPTMQPTVKDDDVTSFPLPTVAPSPDTEVAIVDYGIAVTNGKIENILPSSYVLDLVNSMDIVAEDVANSFTLGENGRRFLRKENQRKLATITTVNLPTSIESRTETECPSFVSANDDCQTVTASIELNIVTEGDSTVTGRQELADPTVVKDLFQESLKAAIEGGALQAALIQVNPESVVSITTGYITLSPTPSPTISDIVTSAPTTAPGGISGGGIAGIVLAGVGGLILGFLIIGAVRRRGLEGSSDSTGGDGGQFEQNVEPGLKQGDDNFGKSPSSDPPTGVGAGTGAAVLAGTAAVGTAAALAAPSASSADKKKRPSDNLYEVPGAKPVAGDDASSAGESGWSSNQDGSSANTSLDASLDSIPQSNFSGIVLGETIGGKMNVETDDKASSSLETPTTPPKSQASSEQEQSSSVSRSLSTSNTHSPGSQIQSQENSISGTTGTDGSIHSTYSELDDAIQKGDWAAVGVTAALLASQAYTDDNTAGSSKQSASRLRRPNTDLNPERAAELDRLVETGDWEGVVAAAAKFDAQEALRGDAQSSQNSEAGSGVDSTAGSSSALSGSGGGEGSSIGTTPSNMSGSQTIDTTTSPSTYTGTGLTATSDTASTRSKARKLNEIRDEVEALVTAVVPEEADNVDEMMTQFRGREEELVETLRSMQERQVAQKARKESQKQAKREAKEYIQDRKKQETLEAVDNTGNTADDIWMKELDDAPVQANEDIKAMKDQLKEALNNENWENVAQAAAGLSGHSPSKGPSSLRDSESVGSVDINELVDKGDWDGVVAAASRYAEVSTNASSSKTGESSEEVADDSTIEQRRKRREDRLREEEEALAQAEIWDAIADQTKVENEDGKGPSGNSGAAKMAADWAIDQSLAALRKAEEEHDDDSQDSGQDKKGDNESL